MNCTRCAVGEISPLTNRCELCGFAPGAVAVEAETTPAEAVDLLARERLADRFRVDVLTGHGPATAVFLVWEHGSGRPLALKAIPRPPDTPADADERFRTAVEASATLDHPHLVPVFAHGVEDGLYWYTREHVRGHSLRGHLATRGPLELRACLRLVKQIGGALDYLHRRGLVHGDLKAENVLIDTDGWVHVTDALVARATSLPAQRTDHVAPEDTHFAQRSPASDQWALAALVHECLTGIAPDPQAETGGAPRQLPMLRPELPMHVAHALARALSPRPFDRYPGVLDFVTALEAGVPALGDARPTGQSSQVVLTVEDWVPPPATVPVRLLRAGAVIAGVAIVALVAVEFVRSRQAPRWEFEPRYDRPAPRQPVDSAAQRAADSAAREASQPEAPPRRQRARPQDAADRPAAQAPAAAPAADGAPPPAPAPGRPRAPAAQQSPAGEPGRLFVSASPWGQVFVDGQFIGNTPRANHSIAAGTHTVRIVRDGYEPYERQVTVAPGEAVRLTGITLVESRP